MNTFNVKIEHLNDDGSVKDTQISGIKEMSYNGETWKYLPVTASSFSAFRVDFSYDGPGPEPEPDPKPTPTPTEDDSESKSYWWSNMSDGWVMKPGTLDWYYVKNGKLLKGWYLESQDGKWYYLDPVTGRMLTGWQLVNGKWYYLNEDKTPSYYVGADGKLIYDTEKKVRPYGSMYADEKTPDGYTVGKDGDWISP